MPVLAKLDYEKYIAEEGEYANALNAANSKITVAQQELEQAKEKWEWSKKLAEQGIVTPTELETDRLNYEKSRIALTQAENDKKLLEQYTHKRKIAELTNNVTQAERALERAKKKAEADVVQAEATLRANKLEYDQLKEKLAFTRNQLKNCTIYAPRTGRVMYADTVSSSRWRRNEPLGEGVEVYERQPLILLSDDTEMMAKVKIHESMRTRVKVGMPVRIQSVELPGVVFTGTVAEIAMTWNMGQFAMERTQRAKPFILLGDNWPDFLKCLKATTEIGSKLLRYPTLVATPEEAVSVLERSRA